MIALVKARTTTKLFVEPLKEVWQDFFEPKVLKETGPEMLKMLLFMALGVFVGWSYMRGSLNSSKLRSSKLQVETLRVNPNRH